MSLTFTKPAESGERGTYSATIPGGLTLSVWDITVGNADVDSPTGGIDLQGNARKMGFNRVVAVLDAYVRVGNDDTVKGMKHIYNCANGKLLFTETVTATLDEQESDTDLVDGDVIRLVVLGV